MVKLPRDADARKVIRALERLGFRIASVSGSHYKLVHETDRARMVVVPFHGKLKTGTLSAILKAARVSLEEFLRIFVLL